MTVWRNVTVLSHCWPLLVTAGYCWLLLVTAGHFWPLLVTAVIVDDVSGLSSSCTKTVNTLITLNIQTPNSVLPVFGNVPCDSLFVDLFLHISSSANRLQRCCQKYRDISKKLIMRPMTSCNRSVLKTLLKKKEEENLLRYFLLVCQYNQLK